MLRTADLAIVMEPTGNALHAGCLGNVNARWTFRGRSGHSARPCWPTTRSTARPRASTRSPASNTEAHDLDGLVFTEVVAVTQVLAERASRATSHATRRSPRRTSATRRTARRPRPRSACTRGAIRCSASSSSWPTRRAPRWRRPTRSCAASPTPARSSSRPEPVAEFAAGRRRRRDRRPRRRTRAPSTSASTRSHARSRSWRRSRAPEPGPRGHADLPLRAPHGGAPGGRRRPRGRRLRPMASRGRRPPAFIRRALGGPRRPSRSRPIRQPRACPSCARRSRTGSRGASVPRSTPTARSSALAEEAVFHLAQVVAGPGARVAIATPGYPVRPVARRSRAPRVSWTCRSTPRALTWTSRRWTRMRCCG